MLGLLGGLLTGIPGVVSAVLSYLTTRNNVDLQKLQTSVGADRDVMIATLQAEVAANQAKAMLLQSGRFMFLLFLLYTPILVHAMIIELGLAHLVTWDAMALTAWEIDILKSLYISVPAVSAVGGFTSWLHK